MTDVVKQSNLRMALMRVRSERESMEAAATRLAEARKTAAGLIADMKSQGVTVAEFQQFLGGELVAELSGGLGADQSGDLDAPEVIEEARKHLGL